MLVCQYFMHPYLRPIFLSLWSHMPIIPQRIWNISPTMRHTWCTDRISIKTKRLYPSFWLMIPKMHRPISTSCWEPVLFFWVKCYWVYRIQDYSIFFFHFMTLKCYMTFLWNKIKKYPIILKSWLLLYMRHVDSAIDSS